MRVLLDHCVPRPFAALLPGHEVRTARSAGWQDKGNGELLRLAATAFDVFVTVDRNLRYQQSPDLPLPVIVVLAANNKPETVAAAAPAVLALLAAPLARQVYTIDVRS